MGTAGPDVIAGLDGVDEIYGNGGDDVICAGPGKRWDPDTRSQLPVIESPSGWEASS